MIASDRIELVYYWPRPRLTVEASHLQWAGIHHYRKGKGDRQGVRLQIATNRATFQSVDSVVPDIAEEIRDAVTALAKK